jgi:hypothetical protein
MAESVHDSPERPTLIEGLVNSLHLPYLLGSLVLATIVGPVGQVLARYIDTFNLGDAVSKTFSIGYQTVPSAQGLIDQGTYFAYLFFAFFAVRYMRLKILDAKPKLVAQSVSGEDGFRKAFRRLSDRLPIVILSILFIPLFIPYAPSLFTQGLAYAAYVTVSSLFLFVLAVSVLWVYVSSLRGLQKVGKGPIRLTPFYEDTLLGLRPIGSLSLSLAVVYFVSLIIVVIGVSTSPDVVTTGVVGIFVVVGIVLFFLPLNAIHKKMVEERHRWQSTLQNQMVKLAETPEATASHEQGTTLDEVQGSLTDLRTLLALQITRENLNAIPTWPFDTRILRNLTVIVLSVVAIIVARELGHFLQVPP